MEELRNKEAMKELDIIAIAFALGSLIIYNIVFLYVSVYSIGKANQTQLSIMIENSAFWARKHQARDDAASSTLAVQTLRNTILVAVFVGGGALNLGLSYTNGYQESDNLAHQIRSIVLSFLCFASFLSWVMVIRFASQLGYLIGTLNIPHTTVISKSVVRKLSSSSLHGINGNISNHDNLAVTTSAASSPTKVISKPSTPTALDLQTEETKQVFAKREQLDRCTKLSVVEAVMFR